MSEKVAVIGAGPAGIQAALDAADLGAEVVVVEKSEEIGGTPASARYGALAPDMSDADEEFEPLLDRFRDHENITLVTGAEVTGFEGEPGDFTLTVKGGKPPRLDAGAVVVATGFEHFDPRNANQVYGYYEHDDVLTIEDAEGMLKDGEFDVPSTGEAPDSVAFIQCVGSRDRQIGNTWCSKVCCGIASKQAIELKEIHPETDVTIFYIDMRTIGFLEDQVYWKAQEDHRVRYVRGRSTEITKKGDRLLVKGEDINMGRPYEVEADVAVLSVGMEPSEGTRAMADVMDLGLESHGWLETTGVLNSTTTTRDGVFVAGAATGPRDLEETVAMAGSAAAKAVATARKEG